MSYRLYIFTKRNYLTGEKPDKTVSKNCFSELPSARPLFTINLPCLDNLVYFLDHTVIMNPFKYSNI